MTVRPLRIGLDATKALPPRDGVGNYSAGLIAALMDLAGDHELWLYGLPRPAEQEHFRNAFANSSRVRLCTAQEPSGDEVDLYHSLSFSFPTRYSGPVLFTCYDLTILTHADFHTVENKVICMLGLLRAVLAKKAHFLAISKASARDLQEQLGVDPRRVTQIYAGVSDLFRRLPAAEVAERLEHRFGLTSPFVLSVGTQEPRKNLLRLVQAYAALPEALRQRFPLVICGGDGWKNDTTDSFLNSRPELAGVLRVGHVSDEDLVSLYNAATVFAFPSLAEGFGLPVAEAMACGAPILTSNLSALPEVAGNAAFLVDPFDVDAIRAALTELLERPDERQRLSELSCQQAHRFSWRKTAGQTLELYERLGDLHHRGPDKR